MKKSVALKLGAAAVTAIAASAFAVGYAAPAQAGCTNAVSPRTTPGGGCGPTPTPTSTTPTSTTPTSTTPTSTAPTSSAPAPGSGSLFSGTIVSGGSPVAGASVTLTAWPVGSVLDGLADDAVVPTKQLAATTTDSAGRYSFSVGVSGLGADYQSPNGAVNVQIDAGKDSDSMDYSAVAAVAGSQAASDHDETAATSAKPMTVGFDFAATTVTSQVQGEAAHSTATANGSQATPDGTADNTPDSSPTGYCSHSWHAGTKYPGRSERFMNLYTYGSATVDEEINSDHELGVGVAVTGGSWSASGSVTLSTTSGAGGDVDYSHNLALYNQVNYRHFTEKCLKSVKGKPGLQPFYSHKVQGTSMSSLLSSTASIARHEFLTSAHACTYYTKGNWHKIKGRNLTFETGVDAPFIKLSAKASYSTDTSVTWHIPSVGADLCGSSDDGWVTSRYAGSEKPPSAGCGATPGNTSSGDPDLPPSESPDC